jgi:hypothetical protein
MVCGNSIFMEQRREVLEDMGVPVASVLSQADPVADILGR